MYSPYMVQLISENMWLQFRPLKTCGENVINDIGVGRIFAAGCTLFLPQKKWWPFSHRPRYRLPS